MGTALLTVLSLLAFAANSVLCRLALGPGSIDAASFSTVRLVSGAATLWVIVALSRSKSVTGHGGNWAAATFLFLYAVAFSFAYVSLNTGTGALILFGSVQVTMIVAGLRSGERPNPFQWAGALIALAGLLYLVSAGLTAPSPMGFTLMVVAGIAWGFYSLCGRSVTDPIGATAENFVRSVPLVLGVSLIMWPRLHLSPNGLLWAVLSGCVTSGVGYILWYAALRGLTATRAAVVQLSVPVLAALGGVLFLSEVISLRLVISAFVTLGGVSLAVLGRQPLVARKRRGPIEGAMRWERGVGSGPPPPPQDN